MSAGIQLLDKYVAVCKHPSDSATARALKVRPSAVNNWRHGRSHPDILSVQKMCEAIGEPLINWVPLVEADRATTPGNKRVWLQLAENAKSYAAGIAIAFSLAVYTPKSDAEIASAAKFTITAPAIHYAKLRRWFTRMLRNLIGPPQGVDHEARCLAA